MMQRDTNPRKGGREEGAADQPGRRSLSMHEDVPTWCDCCSCEAEPRWQAVEEELEREASRQAEGGPTPGRDE